MFRRHRCEIGVNQATQQVTTKGKEIHNNIIWGRTQRNRYGRLSVGQNLVNLELNNSIILSINDSHMDAAHNPAEHRLDYNLFGIINSGEYSANSHDLVGNPQFKGIPMSSGTSEHKGSNLTLDDFRSSATQVIDTGTASSGVPAYDIESQARPQGTAWDRGPFEQAPKARVSP